MALTGELEDLALTDIVQVIALGRPTGYLRIETRARQEAAIGFRQGRIVFAYTWQSGPLVPDLLPDSPVAREAFLKRRMLSALRVMLRLEVGRFQFQLADSFERSVGRAGLVWETLAEGLDPQATMLDLARELDEERHRSPGATRVDLGDDRMMAEFRKRLGKLVGKDHDAHYSLGIAYRGMGLLDDAVREFEAAASDPAHALACSTMLGLCQLERGNAIEAARCLEKGVALAGLSEHQRQSLRPLLAIAYSAAGRVADALEIYEVFERQGTFLADLAARAAQRASAPAPRTRTA